MAAKTFTITTAGSTAGQQIDDNTVAVYILGQIKDGGVQIQSSPTNSNFVNLTGTSSLIAGNSVSSIAIPGGWFARVVTTGFTPTITVVVQ